MENYDYIGKIFEGLRRVKIGVLKNFKCGYIDKYNNLAIPMIYSSVKDFNEGLAAVRIGNWASNKWGYINIYGELVIPIIFEKPRPFSEGLAKVVFNNEWCFIDKKGEKVISLKDYNGCSSFHNGYAIVNKHSDCYWDETFGVIDKTGAEIIPCNVKCYQIHSFFKCYELEERVKQYNVEFNYL